MMIVKMMVIMIVMMMTIVMMASSLDMIRCVLYAVELYYTETVTNQLYNLHHHYHHHHHHHGVAHQSHAVNRINSRP